MAERHLCHSRSGCPRERIKLVLGLVDTAAMGVWRTGLRTCATAAVLVALLAGCGAPQGAVTLRAAKPSVIQGLPVPTQASLIHVTNQHGASGAGYVVLVGAENVIRVPRAGFSRNRPPRRARTLQLVFPGQREDGDLAIEEGMLHHDVSCAPSSRIKSRNS